MTDTTQKPDLVTANEWLKALLALLPVWQEQYDSRSVEALAPELMLASVAATLNDLVIPTVITQYDIDCHSGVRENESRLQTTAYTIQIKGHSSKYDTMGHDNDLDIVRQAREDIGWTLEEAGAPPPKTHAVDLLSLLENIAVADARAIFDLNTFLAAHLLSLKMSKTHADVPPSPRSKRL